MSDYYEHNPGDHEDPLPGPTWLIGFIGVVLLVVVVLGVTALYFDTETEEATVSVLQTTPMELEELDAQQLARLEGPPRWEVEVAEGSVTARRIVIPIDEAMERIVVEMGRQAPRGGGS